MLKTRITELLGIRYPVFQGGMAWVADAKLAAAVSNAGGLGLIGVAEHSHHASLVQGNIGGTCRHVSLPGTPVGITALPLIDAQSGHVGPGLLGDSDHGIHLLRFRDDDFHENLLLRP